MLNGHQLCSGWGSPLSLGGSLCGQLGGQDSGAGGSTEQTSPWPPVSLSRPRCPGLIWSEPALALPLGLQLLGHHEAPGRPSTRWARRPLPPHGLLTGPPWPETGHLGGVRARGSGAGCGGLPGIPARRMGEGFPSFCLYMAEERRRCSVGPTGLGGIVLRGCLASGSEALDSYKILAGKLFDSFDNVLESPREACPGGPRARGASAARRAGELWQQARGCPPWGPGQGGTPLGLRFRSRVQCGQCVPPRKQGGTWA